jgi:hypothetical protein
MAARQGLLAEEAGQGADGALAGLLDVLAAAVAQLVGEGYSHAPKL